MPRVTSTARKQTEKQREKSRQRKLRMLLKLYISSLGISNFLGYRILEVFLTEVSFSLPFHNPLAFAKQLKLIQQFLFTQDYLGHLQELTHLIKTKRKFCKVRNTSISRLFVEKLRPTWSHGSGALRFIYNSVLFCFVLCLSIYSCRRCRTTKWKVTRHLLVEN